MMKKTYDYLNGTDIYLYQRKDMFRINTDTALLGHFYSVKDDESLLDIGCNNGALLLFSKGKKIKRVGIDIQEDAIELAKENLKLNEIEAELYVVDLKDFKYEQFDCIVCNPPYFKVQANSNVNESMYLRIARHEIYLPLDNLFKYANELLKDTGRMYIVHRANRIMEILTLANKWGLKAKEVQFVYDENKDEAISVLVMFTKGKQDECKILKPKYLRR